MPHLPKQLSGVGKRVNSCHQSVVFSLIFLMLVSCSYHSSFNRGSKLGDGGTIIEETEVERLEKLVGSATDEDLLALSETVNSENVNARYSYPQKHGEGVTLLMIAADWLRPASIRFLIELGADNNLLDANGRDAFFYAERKGRERLQDRNQSRWRECLQILTSSQIRQMRRRLQTLVGESFANRFMQEFEQAIQNNRHKLVDEMLDQLVEILPTLEANKLWVQSLPAKIGNSAHLPEQEVEQLRLTFRYFLSDIEIQSFLEKYGRSGGPLSFEQIMKQGLTVDPEPTAGEIEVLKLELIETVTAIASGLQEALDHQDSVRIQSEFEDLAQSCKAPLGLGNLEEYVNSVKAIEGPAPVEELNAQLILAVVSGDQAKIETLVDEGADLNHLTEDGVTPLMVALLEKQWGVVNRLLQMASEEKLLDLNIRSTNGETALGMTRRVISEESDRRARRNYQRFAMFIEQFGGVE